MSFPILNTPKKCVVCGGEVKKGRRYDTIYCGAKCKQAAYVAREKAKKDEAKANARGR
jgi:predicted nucleic acid-binding Zn ribbon protein